jgi:hypothetical protein
MNFELTAPAKSARISLSSSSVIVSVDVNVWTATKQDRSISNEVTTLKNASADAGKFTKNLLANCPQHKALLNYRQTIYNWLQRSTYDWAGGMRILPTINLEKFKAQYEEHEREFAKLLAEFEAIYPTLVSDAAFKQGDMFNRSDYPDVQEIRGKFRIKMFVTKVPENDFRSGVIADAIAEDLKHHYEQQVTEIVDGIMNDAAERFLEIASRLRNACEEAQPSEDGKVKRKKIYETTVTQAKEIAKTLKAFNLTDNRALADACDAMDSALSNVSLDDLRESSYVRQTVKSDLDDILNKFRPIGL